MLFSQVSCLSVKRWGSDVPGVGQVCGSRTPCHSIERNLESAFRVDTNLAAQSVDMSTTNYPRRSMILLHRLHWDGILHWHGQDPNLQIRIRREQSREQAFPADCAKRVAGRKYDIS